MTERFEAYCRRKEAAAVSADIPGYTTTALAVPADAVPLGNAWSRAMFDGEFYRSVVPTQPDVPVTSLVFVQSRDGNTVAPLPSALGGGHTDLHVVYEGLSRVDADAVMAGAGTARARELVFSIWHPELVALRLARGLGRHPAQVVVTNRGDLPFEDGLMFTEPELRVFVLTRAAMVGPIRERLQGRPWVEVINTGDTLSLTTGMRALHTRGLRVVSCVGGRRTATPLLLEGLVSDIYLTTSAIHAGEPNTPYYDGPALPLGRVLCKAGQGVERGVRFEHFVVVR